MKQPQIRRAARLFGAGLLGIALVVVACSSKSTSPVTPTPAPLTQPTASQTLTITANGVFPSIAFIDANTQLKVINNDTQVHMLHLDLADQPGCSGFDAVGELQPGESRLTGAITSEAAGCDGHDHMKHGDQRFLVQIVVGEGI